MTERTLTITQMTDWRAGLRAAGKAASRGRYAGEVLNFESPSQFFGQLTEKRWELLKALRGAGPVSIREAARRVVAATASGPSVLDNATAGRQTGGTGDRRVDWAGGRSHHA